MSLSIVSRLMNIDLPYQSQWFEYYNYLGVNHFYLYYIDHIFLDLENILSYYPKEKITLKKIPLSSIQDSNNVFADDPFDIKEDYILHIDSDEYLYLNGLRLNSFLEKNQNIDVFYFCWYMCPSSNLSINNMNDVLKSNIKKYFIKTYKALTRNKNIKFMRGYTHDFHFTNNNMKRAFMENPYFLIHFSYRGIYDSYYKFIYQKLPNHNDINLYEAKMNILNKSINGININKLPSRISVFLGEVCNQNQDIQMNITLPIFQKSQINIYTLFDPIDKDIFKLYIKRIQQLLKLELFKDITLPNMNIKKFIKTQSLQRNRNIIFEK
jgi:hypothetical protein